MKSRILLLASVLFLAIGIDIVFSYGKGNAGFNVAYPIDGARFELSIATTGAPAITGFSLTLVGVFLLLLTLIVNVVAICRAFAPQSRRKRVVKVEGSAAV